MSYNKTDDFSPRATPARGAFGPKKTEQDAVAAGPPTQTEPSAAQADKNTQKLFIERQILNIIIQATCNVYAISRKQLLNSKTRGVRTEALMLLFVFLKQHREYSLKKIEGKFKYHYANVGKLITRFNQMHQEDAAEAIILLKWNRLVSAVVSNPNYQKLNGTQTAN